MELQEVLCHFINTIVISPRLLLWLGAEYSFLHSSYPFSP